MSPDDPRHGSTRGYHAGCRCEPCRAANRRYEKHSKYRKVAGIKWAIPALGAQRRIQALMALGWTGTDIAHAAGWKHRNCVRRILVGQKGKPCVWIERKTWRTICDVYERHSMRLPTPAPHRARTRALAARNGWAPPLAWCNIDDPREEPRGIREPEGPDQTVDPVVVERILSGEWRTRSNRAERVEVCRRAVAAGVSLNEIAKRTGWKVERYWRAGDEAA